MENRYFDIDDIKERFALLLSKLHEANFLTDYINDRIINSPFFDCFEKNDFEEFMTLSIETITEKIFGKEVTYNYSLNPITPYYWAGLSIIEIMANYKIPLKRILLIMPLRAIIGCYDLFHEMNPIKFIEHYLEKEKNTPLLKILRKENKLSIPNVSYLTGINMSLLKRMDYSNDTLLSTSFKNLNKLADLFNVSTDVFKKESSFLAYSNSLFKDNTFSSILYNNILKYYGFEENSSIFVTHKFLEDKEIRELVKEKNVIIDISNPFGIYYVLSQKVIRKYLSSEEFSLLYKKSIDEFKFTVDSLVF